MLSLPPSSLVPNSLLFKFSICLVTQTIRAGAGEGVRVYRAPTVSNLSFILIDKIS